jgi:hypothetical protein
VARIAGKDPAVASNSDTSEKADAKFYFIKSQNYLEIPVHGAFGGINPATGQSFMAVYSERSPIPQEVFYEPAPDGTLRELTGRRVGREGPVRIVQAVLHFDINTALALRNWLDDKIASFARAHPEIADKLEMKK